MTLDTLYDDALRRLPPGWWISLSTGPRGWRVATGPSGRDTRPIVSRYYDEPAGAFAEIVGSFAAYQPGAQR